MRGTKYSVWQIFYWLLIINSSLLFGNEPVKTQTFHINIGENIEVPILEGANINVSRRGIIDIKSLVGGMWRVMGMRKGFVKVSWFNEETQKEREFFVDVSTPKSSTAQLRDQDWQRQPHKLCGHMGITCSHHDSVMGGIATDYLTWVVAKRRCLDIDDCLFASELTTNAGVEFRHWLQSRLSTAYEVMVDSFNVPFVTRDCDESQEQSFAETLRTHTAGIVGDLVLFRCTSGPEFKNLRIRAKVILVEKSALKELGVSPTFNGEEFLTIPAAKIGFAVRLKALEKTNKAKVISEPMLIIKPMQTARLTNGGEFQVMYATENEKDGSKEGWKKFGLDFSAKIEILEKNFLELWIEMSLKKRSNAASNELATSSFQSTISIKINEPQIIAASNMLAHNQFETSHFGLKQIPILGPLFRTINEDENHLKMLLWVIVEKTKKKDKHYWKKFVEKE